MDSEIFDSYIVYPEQYSTPVSRENQSVPWFLQHRNLAPVLLPILILILAQTSPTALVLYPPYQRFNQGFCKTKKSSPSTSIPLIRNTAAPAGVAASASASAGWGGVKHHVNIWYPPLFCIVCIHVLYVLEFRTSTYKRWSMETHDPQPAVIVEYWCAGMLGMW